MLLFVFILIFIKAWLESASKKLRLDSKKFLTNVVIYNVVINNVDINNVVINNVDINDVDIDVIDG